MYLIDYHIHSRHSNDGSESIFKICNSAIEKGFSEIAVTDHFDPCQSDVNCIKSYNYDNIYCDLTSVKRFFGSKIKILMGIELGQIGEYPESAKTVLQHPFDYVITSLHNIRNDVDLAKFSYTKGNFPEVMDEYFHRLIKASKLGLYDCIGHLDYPKRYAALYGIKLNPADYMQLTDEILRNVISLGKGIEINCSGRRQQVNETLPSFEIVKRYKELGGEIITVGSDAHRLIDVGNKIDDGYIMAAEAGFKYITTFKKRCPKLIKL